jgi:hypothetical protein
MIKGSNTKLKKPKTVLDALMDKYSGNFPTSGPKTVQPKSTKRHKVLR